MKYPTAKIKRECVDENLIEIDPAKLIRFSDKIYIKISTLGLSAEKILEVRNGGDFNDRALYLSGDYDWILAKDLADELCLIPLRKE